MKATIIEVLPHGMFDTVIRFRATLDDDSTVIAGGDHRPMRDVIRALADGETPETWIEEWQVVAWEGGP